MQDVSHRKMSPLHGAVELLIEAEAWIDDLIFIVDRNFVVQHVNRIFEIQLAPPGGTDAGPASVDWFSREVLQFLRPMFKAVFETGRRRSHEIQLTTGERKMWLDTRLTPVKDSNDRVVSILGVSREITERIHREQSLSRSRQGWLTAVDALPFVMASTDAHHRIVRINKAMARKMGVSVRKAVGLTCYRHIRGLKAPPPFCPLLVSNQVGDNYSAGFTEKTETGRWHVTVRPITGLDGRVVGCLYAGYDAKDGQEPSSRMEKNRQVMKQFLVNADHAFLIQDREGRYIFFNSVPSTGPMPSGLVGTTPFDYFELDEAARMVQRVKTVADTGMALSEERQMTIDGQTFTFFDQMSPIWDSPGDVTKVVTVKRRIFPATSGAMQVSAPKTSDYGLSKRECQVLRLIAQGRTNRQIADKLFISKKTVETHRARIMRKLNLHKASALVSFAVKSGIV